MKERDKHHGLFTHSVKNKLFWSFVYILISVWCIVVIYQTLLGELSDLMLLKNDLNTIDQYTQVLRRETALFGKLTTASQQEVDVEWIPFDAYEVLKKDKDRLQNLLDGFPGILKSYRFFILKRTAGFIGGDILKVKQHWETASPLIDKLAKPGSDLTGMEFDMLLKTLDDMDAAITPEDETNPQLYSSIVSIYGLVKRYYQAGYVVFIFLLILVFVTLYNGFIRPLGKLNYAFEQVKAGDLDTRLELKGDDEFTELAKAFNAMVFQLDTSQKEFMRMNQRLRTLFSEREAELKEKKVSLDMARLVQQAIIPQSFKRRNLSFATGLIPYEELSGDFLDIFPLDEKHLGFLFGDIMGKGIPASLKMMSFHSMFRATISENKNPVETARTINRLEIAGASGRLEHYQLTTAIMGKIDLVTMKFHLVNCGHPPPIMWRERQEDAFELPLGNPIIGFDYDAKFEEIVIDMAEGDIIFFYTDGLSEQCNASGEEYNVEQIKKTIGKYHNLPPEEFVARLLAEIGAVATQGNYYKDDILFCVLKIEKYPWLILSFPKEEREKIGESLVDYMRTGEVPNDIISDMNLVFEELFSNAFLHGNKEDAVKHIDVSICVAKGEIILRVEDEGEGFDVSKVDFLLSPERMYGERGRGLYMIRNIVDDIEFNEKGNCVTVRKKFNIAGGAN